ncbi:MAG: hypothetical protein R6X06_03375 [Gammaproteobacteria bacterium]
MKNSRGMPYTTVLLYGLCMLCYAPPAAAELLSLVAVAEGEHRTGQAPIEIRLGPEMPPDLIPYLRLEVDAIDVTDFVTTEGALLRFRPPQALTPGQHQLRVVAVLPDGVIEEAAVWTIEIRASAAFRVAEVNGQLDLQVTQRLTDNLLDPPSGRTQGQGAIGLNSQHANDGWRTTTQANMLYNSQEAQGLSENAFDLTDYQIRTDWTQSAFTLGHQTLPVNSLVLNQFNRRGLSVSTRTEGNAVQLNGFATRTEEITGFKYFTGLEDSGHRTSGLALTGFPLEQQPERLAITAVYLDGQGAPEGVAEVNDSSNNVGGQAQAIIIDSYLQNKRWRLRAEHARSDFDFDGVHSGYAAVEDTATNFLLGYDTARAEDMTEPSDHHWGISVVHQDIGPWFYSLGNSTNTVDRRTTQLLGHYQGPGLGVNGTLSLGEDNVDNITSLPTTRIESAAVYLSYVPQPAAQDTVAASGQAAPPAESLFSNPAYTLSWTQNSLDQIRTPLGYSGDDVNSRYDELAVAATFSGSDWYWSLNHALIKQDDKVNVGNQADTVSSGLESQLTLTPYLSITPVLQKSVTDYRNLQIKSRAWLAAATLNLNYPEHWSHNLSYTVNREVAGDDSIDTLTRIAQLAVQWRYREAKRNQFGLSLFSTASHRQATSSGVETDEYQVFVGVNIALPAHI